MLINLSDLLTKEGKVKTYSIQLDKQSLLLGGEEFKILRQAPVELKISHIENRNLMIEGQLDISLGLSCGRCLQEVAENFSLEIYRDLDMKQSDEDRVNDLDEQPYVVGYNLDVDQLVCNELFVNLPMKVLCNDDCKGICNRCGTNLNDETCDCDITELDPRMAVIRDIFNNARD